MLRLFLNFGHTLDHLLMLIFPTVVLAIGVEYGRPYSELLPLALGGFIAFGACSLPAGWLADRWSRGGMMTVFFIGIGAATMATGLAQTPVQIAVGLTFIGVFAAIYHPVGIAMLVSNVPENLGRVLGVNGVWGNVGVAVAALVAGALAEWVHWRAAFLIPGALAIATGIAFAVLKPRASASKPATRVPPPRLTRDLLLRAFMVLAVAIIANSVIFNATTISMPKLFDERLSAITHSTAGIGLMVCIVYLIAAVAQLIIGSLIDRIGLKRIFVPVVALQIPLLLAAASTENFTMLVVAAGMMFFVFGQIPINDAMVARYTVEEWRARAFAVRYVVSFAASATAVPLVAWSQASGRGFPTVFVILAALAAIALVVAFFFPKETPVAARAAAQN